MREGTPIPATACGLGPSTVAGSQCGGWFGFPFWFVSLDRWIFVGGGGMSGVRNTAGQCVLTTMNPLSSFSPQFGWGNSALHLDLRGTPYITQLVLGVLSYTHG